MNNDTNRKPNLKQAVPFFRSLNMFESLKFYVDGLGFDIKNKWEPHGSIEWCWLERDGVAIMLQEPRKEWLEKHPQTNKLGEGISIEFQCEDAIALYHEFLERGLTPTEPTVGNGLWVTSVKDPDGFCLGFESQTDVPEETTYSKWKSK
jgi:uncharacterized glyoxalase superfamily protein PhnB